MTETKHKPVSVPYDPAECIGDFGHLWFRPENQSEPEWVLIHTFEDNDDELAFNAMTDGCSPEDADVYDAALYVGVAYIPVSAPSCGPTAGAMVRVWLPGGGVMTVTHEDRDEAAQAMTDSVLALLTGGGNA